MGLETAQYCIKYTPHPDLFWLLMFMKVKTMFIIFMSCGKKKHQIVTKPVGMQFDDTSVPTRLLDQCRCFRPVRSSTFISYVGK